MASNIIVTEKIDSGRRSDSRTTSSIEFTYVIRDVLPITEQDAMTALSAFAGTTYGVMEVDTISVVPITDLVWSGAVKFSTSAGSKKVPKAQPVTTGQIGGMFSFDTGGGSTRVFNSLATASYAPAGQTAPNYQGAIGVVGGEVQGVDIVEPVYHFTETYIFDNGFVNGSYKNTVRNLAGTVNNAPFRGLDAHEVLFLGATGAMRTDGQWDVTFKFASRKNQTGIAVGAITGIEKGGWEYLWVDYETTEDVAAKTIVKTPVAAYVEQVYLLSNFSALGVGT